MGERHTEVFATTASRKEGLQSGGIPANGPQYFVVKRKLGDQEAAEDLHKRGCGGWQPLEGLCDVERGGEGVEETLCVVVELLVVVVVADHGGQGTACVVDGAEELWWGVEDYKVGW